MDPLYEEVYDSATGQTYLVDPLTGQLVTLTAADGTEKPAIGYNPAARQLPVHDQIVAQSGAGATFVPPDTGRQAVDASGRLRPELTPLLPAPATEQPLAAGSSSTSGGYGSGGYSRGGYGYGGYSRGGYGGGGYDEYGTTPRYANNQRHPYFGGDPLTPGGIFAQQSAGYDNRVQVTNPETGASAGPFGVTAPRAAQADHPGMGRPGGGGGGIARDLYWDMANKIKAKLTGGGTASSTYGAYEQPKTFRPYRGPEDPRTARRVDRLDARRASQASTYAHPEFAIPKGVNLESPLGGRMTNLPGFDLTLLAGAGKKNWKGGIDPTADAYDAYYKQLGKRLEAGKQGIDFYPFYKREMRKDKSLDQYNAKLKTIYRGVAQGMALDRGQLFNNLSNPRKGTFLHQQFKNAPAGAAADQYLQSFGAILNSGEYSDIQQTALANLSRNAVTAYGQRYSGRNPRRIPSMARYVGRQIGGYFG